MRVKITDIHAGWPIGSVVTLSDKDAQALVKLGLAVPHVEVEVQRTLDRRETKDTPKGQVSK